MKLRPLARADVESLAAWLPGVAAQAGCDRWSVDDALADAIGRPEVLVGVESDVDAFLAFALRTPVRDAARVELLAVPPDRRRLGIAGRAALALERLLPASVKRVHVTVPARLGLALYFWLRLGYRPLTRGAWPAEPDDQPSTWMVRAIR